MLVTTVPHIGLQTFYAALLGYQLQGPKAELVKDSSRHETSGSLETYTDIYIASFKLGL